MFDVATLNTAALQPVARHPTLLHAECTVEPAIELPASPLGKRGGRQCPFVTPQPSVCFACFGLGFDGHSDTRQTFGTEMVMEFVGQRLGSKCAGVDAFRRRLELPRDRQVCGGLAQIGRVLVVAACQSMSSLTLATEATDHIRRRQCSKCSKSVEAQSLQDIGERRLLQRRDRQIRQELGTGADGNDNSTGTSIGESCCQSCGEDAIGHSEPGVTTSGKHRLHDLMHSITQWTFASEEPGGTTGGEANEAWTRHFDTRCNGFECRDHRLEEASFTVDVSFEHVEIGTSTLGVTAPLPDSDSLGSCRG